MPGSLYHLSFRFGSRSNGACAAASHDYITRARGTAGRDPAILSESDHLPAWADGDARTFWDAVDLYEQARARLFVSADYALPRDFDQAEWIELARDFACGLTAGERLPYTLAIHGGVDAEGRPHNPHAHLMISERREDHIARQPRHWFRRANRQFPDRGGTQRSEAFHRRDWLEEARKRWADRLNTALERKGSVLRVDHRSYARQGLDREPGLHLGPAGAYLTARGLPHDRLEEAALSRDDLDRLAAIEREIVMLETERDGLAHLMERLHEYPRPPSDGGSSQRSRDDEGWPGR